MHPTKIIFCFLIIYLSASLCAAQGTPPPPPGYSAEQAKQWKEELKKRKKEQKKAYKDLTPEQKINDKIYPQITSEYDKFKDSTFLSLALMPVYIPNLYTKFNKEPHFYMNASCVFVGTNSKPKSFAIGFVSKELQGYWFNERRELTFLADGKRIYLGSTSHDGNARSLTFLGNTTYITNEAMSIGISVDDFLHLANAKNVEFQLGSVEGYLSEKHLEAFRALIARIPNS